MIGRILVALDGSELAREAFEYGATLAEAGKVPLEVVHVAEPVVALREKLCGSADALVAAGAHSVEVTVADVDDPLLGDLYQSDAEGLLSATVSVWVDSLDGRGDIEAVLGGLTPRMAAYLATESMPREYADRCFPNVFV